MSTAKPLTPIYHFTPKNDTYNHVLDAEGTCWCSPERSFDGEDITFQHHAYDRREDYEEGRRKPH